MLRCNSAEVCARFCELIVTTYFTAIHFAQGMFALLIMVRKGVIGLFGIKICSMHTIISDEVSARGVKLNN